MTAVPTGVTSVGEAMEGAVTVAIAVIRSTTTTEARWCCESRRWAIRGWKVVIRCGYHVVHVTHLSRAALMTAMPRSNTQWVLGEAKADAALGAVMEHVTIQIMKSFRGEGDVLKFYKAHGAIGLCAEAETLVSTLLGECRLKLFLRSVKW